MEQSDIVSLHCPVTDQSRGMINAETLSYMKPTAFLVNEARGPVVDSQALADASTAARSPAPASTYSKTNRLSIRIIPCSIPRTPSSRPT